VDTRRGAGGAAACRRHLDAAPPPAYDGPPRTIHNDIFPEHVLVDETGLAGILDWGDACFGDPAADFACAGFLGGEALLDATLARYRGDVDAERARYGARGMAVGFVLYGTRRPDAHCRERGRAALVRLGLLRE
jgi:aminoglycoside phosphotransferase (APT) family kinase protein